MKSLLLTKINAVNLPYKDQMIEFDRKGDKIFLDSFVKFIHKGAEIINEDDSIKVFTSKGQYMYIAHSRYILRIDLNSQKRKIYKIS